MPVPVSQYRNWVDQRNDPTDRKQLAHAALDTYESLAAEISYELNDLTPIVTAAKSPYLVAWDVGTEFLIRLAETNTTAQRAIRDIVFNGRKVNERFQIVASLRFGLPDEFCIELIRHALDDKGIRVREKAAEAADRLRLKQLLPDLESRLNAETKSKVREAIEFHIAMLRDGYLVRWDDDGRPRLTVRTKRGWGSPSITQQDIDDGKLDDKVRELQSKDY